MYANAKHTTESHAERQLNDNEVYTRKKNKEHFKEQTPTKTVKM